MRAWIPAAGAALCLILSGCGKTYTPVVPPETSSAAQAELELTTAPEPETETVLPERTEQDGQIRSYLTGQMKAAAQADRRPAAVMISNDKAALPQYGLGRAGVVYEAPVEGGMNRYMAILEEYDDLERIGSVRSSRTYYTYFAREFDAVYVHYGQSTFALPYLETMDNINGITGTGGNAFYRSGDKKAPHNAYTSGSLINEMTGKLGYSQSYSEDYEGHYRFAGDGVQTELTQPESMEAYRVVPGYVLSKPWFEYDETDGLYHRYQYGAVHEDSEGPLTVKNILIQYCRSGYYGETEYLDIDVHTSQGGYYITNGRAVPVTWKKDGEYGPTRYYDSEGNEIILNQGKTWVCIVSAADISKTEIYGKQQ